MVGSCEVSSTLKGLKNIILKLESESFLLMNYYKLLWIWILFKVWRLFKMFYDSHFTSPVHLCLEYDEKFFILLSVYIIKSI